MKYQEVVSQYKDSYKNYLISYTCLSQTVSKQRFFITDLGVIAIYGKGMRRRGYPVPLEARTAEFEVIPVKQTAPAKKWLNSWQKVAKMLEDSGLWDNLLHDIRIGLEIGFDNIQEMAKIDNRWDKSISYEENKKKNSQEIEAISKLLELVTDRSFIIWHMARPANVKKMNFGKFQTERITADLAEALKSKIRYQARQTGGKWTGQSYDTSIEYSPDSQKAWYSEEYRGCGNGHYYLAINATHAIYYEKD